MRFCGNHTKRDETIEIENHQKLFMCMSDDQRTLTSSIKSNNYHVHLLRHHCEAHRQLSSFRNSQYAI